MFVASSVVEFAYERAALGAFIQELNSVLVQKNIYIEKVACEYLPGDISITRKQDDYNRKIYKSDYFFLFVGKRVGEYTLEELAEAKKSFQRTGTPQIHSFFKEGLDIEDSVNAFLSILDEQVNCHTFSTIKDVAIVLLQILEERFCFSAEEKLVFDKLFANMLALGFFR